MLADLAKRTILFLQRIWVILLGWPVAKMMAEFESDPDHPLKSAMQRGWSRLTMQIFQILLLSWSCKEESQVH